MTAAWRKILDRAVARLLRDGIAVGLEGVRMEEAIAEAGVSRATAYRRWPTRDDFLAEVLVETIRRTTLVPESREEVARLVALVDAQADSLDDAQGRRDLVVEALRLSVDWDVRRLLASPEWRTQLSVRAIYPTMAAGRVRDAVCTALRDLEREFNDRRATIYTELARMVGYRLAVSGDAERGFAVLSSAAGALMSGILLRAAVDPDWLDARHESAMFGASTAAPWSEPEQHLVGLLLSHLEPDPQVGDDPERIRDLLADFDARTRRLLEPGDGEQQEAGAGGSD